MLENMPNGRYIFIWGGLIKDAGGMTRVMLDRVCRFKQSGVPVTVLLGGRGREQYDVISIYKRSGYSELNKNDFLCMEDWLSRKLTTKEKIIVQQEFKQLFPEKRKNNIQLVYDNGILHSKRYYDDCGNLLKTEKYNQSSGENNHFIESIDFYYNNQLCKTLKFVNDKEKVESYYAENGFCYMSQEFYENKEKTVRLFNQNDFSVTEYASISAVREFFYSQYVMEHYTEDLFVFCDPILDLEPGFRYMKEISKYKLYKIAINHGIGFALPRNWNSRCNPRFQRYLEVPSTELDAVILLTDVALENIKKRFGNLNIFKCIPNKVNINPVCRPVKDRNINKTVCVGRFSKEKQFIHVVKAFALVVKKHPNAVLELYGRGDEEEAIKNEIIKNKLENNVMIKGFSRNVEEVFSDAILSVVSSEYAVESFCLSLVESLANGCPVVSYKMKFGSAYVIKNGYNGFLSSPDNIDELAANISKVYDLSNKDLQTMSQNAYLTSQIFNESKYEENWENVLHEIVEQKNKRSYVEDMEVNILNIIYSNTDHKMMIKGNLSILGNIPANAKGSEKIYLRIYTAKKDDYILKKVESTKKDDGDYIFEIEIKDIYLPMSICFECTNSFLEKDITETIHNILAIKRLP